MPPFHNDLKTGFVATQNNPKNLKLQLNSTYINLVSSLYAISDIPHYPILIFDACRRSANIYTAPFWPCRSIRIWCCYMLPVPLHPDMWRSMMPVATCCRSVLIPPTIQCMSTLHATRDSLHLSVLLLPDLCWSVPLCDTKSWLIDPRCQNHGWTQAKPGYLTLPLQLILPHTTLHHIRYLN